MNNKHLILALKVRHPVQTNGQISTAIICISQNIYLHFHNGQVKSVLDPCEDENDELGDAISVGSET